MPASLITGDGESTANNLKTVGEKRERMRQTLENIQSQSNSILHLALQWKELEDYFDAMFAASAKREEEVDLKSKQNDWKIKYLKKKSIDIEEKKAELKESLEMAEERCAEVDEMYEAMREKERRVEEDFESLRCKLERLREDKRELKRYFKKKELKLESKELSIENREYEVEFRAEKLNSIERDLLERIQEIEEREWKIELKEKGICDKNGILKVKNEGFGEKSDYADIRFNIVMNGKDLIRFLSDRVDDHEKLRDEVTRGIGLSADPPKLVLDAIEGFYPEKFRDSDVGFVLSVVRKSCVLLLEQLYELKAKIKAHVKVRAIRVAMEWKEKMNVGDANGDGGCCLEVVGFLQLVATYGLLSEFHKEDLVRLFECCSRHDRAPELCRSLGLADDVHDIIKNLVHRDQQIEAVRLIYAFEMANIIPPVPLLKTHLKSSFHNAEELYENGNVTQEMQIKCIDMKLAVLDSVVRCIKDCDLESKYSVRELEHQILKLKIQKKKCNPPVSDSKAKITIQNEGLCISLPPSSSSDNQTAFSNRTSLDKPVTSTQSQKHSHSTVGADTHYDPAVADEAPVTDNFQGSSLTESSCISYASGTSPGSTPWTDLMSSRSSLPQARSSSLDAETQDNRGGKRPRLASVVVGKDLERENSPPAYEWPAAYQQLQTPVYYYLDNSTKSWACGAYSLAPHYPYPLPT